MSVHKYVRACVCVFVCVSVNMPVFERKSETDIDMAKRGEIDTDYNEKGDRKSEIDISTKERKELDVDIKERDRERDPRSTLQQLVIDRSLLVVHKHIL